MKNLQTIGGIVFLLLLFSHCTKEAGYYKEEIPEGNVKMKSMSQQRVSDQMIIEIVDILDTRCPVGEVCSAEGEVKIDFMAYLNGRNQEFTVNYSKLKSLYGCSTTIEGHDVTVTNVTPYPYSNRPIENISDYCIEVKVEKIQ